MTLRRRALLAAAALAALVVVALVYARAGWDRMESHCGSEAVLAERGQVSAFSWEWQPPGFTCTFRDGGTTTSLWF